MVAASHIAPTRLPAGAPNEFVSVQYLRGVAAFGVLCFHAAERAGLGFSVGAAGVDIFFVISGFIMWVVTFGRGLTPAQFLLRRIERIVPLYWAITVAVAAASIALPGAFPRMSATLGHVLGSIFFVPHRDPSGQIYPLIAPGWSLNYEMFFYLIFCASLAMAAKARVAFISGVLLLCVLAGRAISSASPLWLTYTDPMLLEFLGGVVLGAMFTAGVSLPGWLGVMLVLGGVAGFAATAALGLDVQPLRLALWGAPALTLVAGAVFLERRWRAPRLKLLHLIGDASYSIYLVHGLAISLVFRTLAGPLHFPDVVVLPAAIAAGVAAGLLTYAIVERPIMRFFKRRARRGSAPQSAAVAPSAP